MILFDLNDPQECRASIFRVSKYPRNHLLNYTVSHGQHLSSTEPKNLMEKNYHLLWDSYKNT